MELARAAKKLHRLRNRRDCRELPQTARKQQKWGGGGKFSVSCQKISEMEEWEGLPRASKILPLPHGADFTPANTAIANDVVMK